MQPPTLLHINPSRVSYSRFPSPKPADAVEESAWGNRDALLHVVMLVPAALLFVVFWLAVVYSLLVLALLLYCPPYLNLDALGLLVTLRANLLHASTFLHKALNPVLAAVAPGAVAWPTDRWHQLLTLVMSPVFASSTPAQVLILILLPVLAIIHAV